MSLPPIDPRRSESTSSAPSSPKRLSSTSYEIIKRILHSEHPTEDSATEELLSQPLTEGEAVNPAIVGNRDTISKVTSLFNAFIQDCVEKKLPESEIYDLRLRMEPILANLHIDGLPIDPMTTRKVIIQCVNDDGKISHPHELEIPFSAYKHMDMLRTRCEGTFKDDGKVLTLILPNGIDLEDFKQYLAFACMGSFPSEVTSFISTVSLLQLCDFMQDVKTPITFLDALERENYSTSAEELSEITSCRDFLPEAYYIKLINCYLNQFLSSSPQETASSSTALHPIDQLDSLKELKSLAELPLELSFPFSHITNEQLTKLSTLLPNVRSLNLNSCASITSIPPKWNETLENLDVRFSNINKISTPIPNIINFYGSHIPQLTDLSGLNNSAALKHLDVSYTSVINLPTGCNNLEEVEIENCQNLMCLSSLNDCKKLTKLFARQSFIFNLPTGCDNLEYLDIRRCSWLMDISSLNNSKKLIHLLVNGHEISNLPTGCDSLEYLDISQCLRLTDLTPLNNSKKLTKLIVKDSGITNVPTGCDNLEILDISHCSDLTDLSPLNDCKKLKELQVNRSGINNLPTRCDNLEEVRIEYCEKLTDLSPLNNSKKLISLQVDGSPITNLPTGCDNLEYVDIALCPKLTDLSPLDNSKKLTKIFVTRTNIDNLPTGCDNLVEASIKGCKNLTDLSPLTDCKKLTKLSISDSAVTSLPRGCFSLTDINVSRTQITDEHLSEYSRYLKENKPK